MPASPTPPDAAPAKSRPAKTPAPTPASDAPPTVPAPSSPAGGGARLQWLDALRGLAALVVVFEHSLDVLFPEIRRGVSPWFDFGRYGVFVFFIVSGYIVPASLERRGSVREFWIGRMFRLYPLWAVAAVVGLGLGLAKAGWDPPGDLTAKPWTSALAHLTMLQDLLGVPNALNVFWTLSYEMVFYLLVTAMFVAGVHRASALTAVLLAAAAAAFGALLPTTLLAAHSRAGTIAAAALLMAGGLVAVMSGNRVVRRCGVAVLGVLALGLVTLNHRVGGVESLAIIATMFAGSGIYRIQKGQTPRWPGIAAVVAVPVLTLAGGAYLALTEQRLPYGATGDWGWPAAVAAAWLTFALGMLLRNRRMPPFLPWLGVISYSVYLLHSPVVQIIWRITDEPDRITVPVRLLWMVVLISAVLVVGALAHRHIELPMQRAGRRLIRRRRARAAAADEFPARAESLSPGPT
ncbi:acyltransferase family protein [Spirillospora sp. NPDC029432]|uniref:acyltransferase family protein n=1 Tax=Spirillospora sp. NPDC029432 TaxID=3154599 RepID=UPI0034541779